MFVDVAASPTTGNVAELSVEGRYAVVLECGLAASWDQSIRRKGERVIGGEVLDLGALKERNLDDVLRVRGESNNAIGLQHRIKIASSDSLEELLSVAPRPFTPFFEWSITTAFATWNDVGGANGHTEISTPGRAVLWAKASAGGGRVRLIGPDRSPVTTDAYMSGPFATFGSGDTALQTFAGIARGVFESPILPGLYRLAVDPAAGGDIFSFQLGTVPL